MTSSSSIAGKERFVERALFVCTTGLIALVFWRLKDLPLVYDEVYHFGRIQKLLSGGIAITDFGAMFPGYHLLLALLLRLTGQTSIAAARFFSLLFSLAACGAAYGVTRTIDPSRALLRTMQFALLPILLPFFPLLYTDTLALALLLASLLAALRGRRVLLAITFLLACFVRQTTVAWTPLLFAILQSSSPRPFEPRTLLRLSFPFLAPVLLVATFIVVTGRATFNPGLAADHPFPFFSLGNVFYALFLFTVLFAPLVLAHGAKILRLLTRPWILVALIALFLLFSVGFTVTHPANSEINRLRDAVLLAADAGGLDGFLFWAVGAVGLLTMTVIPLERRSFLWIYPVSLALLSMSWLIETRYAIAPLALWLLLRKTGSWRWEIVQYGYFLALLVLILR